MLSKKQHRNQVLAQGKIRHRTLIHDLKSSHDKHCRINYRQVNVIHMEYTNEEQCDVY